MMTVVRSVGYFVSEGLTKEEAIELKKDVAALKELVGDGNIRIEALLSWVLEKENITQDKFDELLSVIKSFGKQKGFKID